MGGAFRWVGAAGMATLPFWIVGQTELLAPSMPGLPVIEVPVASRYFADASSVGFRQGVVYGLGTLWTAARFLLHRWGLARCDRFKP